MQNNKSLYSEWIKFAETDFNAATALFKNESDFLNIVVFLCHQSCEKIIKACLIKLEIRFKKTHDLQALLSQLKSQSFFSENLFDTIEIFEKFNVEIRYPDAEVTPTKEEAAEALKQSKILIKFLKTNIDG